MEHLGNMDVGESMFMLILINGTSAKANISWTNMLENPNMCRCKFTGVKHRIHQSWNHYKLSLYHMYFPKVNISKPILHKYLWQFGTAHLYVHLFFEWEKNDDCPRDILSAFSILHDTKRHLESRWYPQVEVPVSRTSSPRPDGRGRVDAEKFWGCFSKNPTEF